MPYFVKQNLTPQPRVPDTFDLDLEIEQYLKEWDIEQEKKWENKVHPTLELELFDEELSNIIQEFYHQSEYHYDQ